MQIKLFTIPVMGGEALTEDMNAFLRSRKILQVESHFLQDAAGSQWCFCIRYADSAILAERDKLKVDYKQVLAADTFKRFSHFRELRKKIALEEAIPAYAVFNDEELAAMAQMENLNLTTMRTVKGIGDKKMEKYGERFLQQIDNDAPKE